MATQAHNASILDLEPDTVIELYELDLGSSEGIYRFHPGKNDLKDIFLSDDNGVLQTYYALPIQADGYEMKGDGSLPRPKILFANPQGIISDAIKNRNDLIGNLLTRKRIFLKFLDNENFPDDFNPFSEPDPNSRFEDDVFIVNRKINESKYYVEYELASPLEFEDVKIPARRMVANYCPWQYRGEGCLYGQKTDYDNQEVKMANGLSLAPKFFFAKENPNASGRGPNLGMPVADNNNKCFTTSTGYNLSLLWQSRFNSELGTIVINNSGGYTVFNVTINNADGYESGHDGDIEVDSLSHALTNGDKVWFGDRATLVVVSGNHSATATTIQGRVYGNRIEDNAVGDAPQTITIDSITLDIGEDRTIVFSNGGRFQLGKSSLYAGGTSTTTLYGYLSEDSLSDDESGDLKYVAGDVVSFPYDIKNLSKMRPGQNTQQDDTTNLSDRMFVCIQDVLPNLDPRYEIEYWVMDDCSKNIRGCRYRYNDFGEYYKGLPFGGFPSIERYKFRG